MKKLSGEEAVEKAKKTVKRKYKKMEESKAHEAKESKQFEAGEKEEMREMKHKKPKLGSGKRFAQLKSKLAAKGAKSPGALTAFIGRKKYGAKKFAQLGAKGKKHKKTTTGFVPYKFPSSTSASANRFQIPRIAPRGNELLTSNNLTRRYKKPAK